MVGIYIFNKIITEYIFFKKESRCKNLRKYWKGEKSSREQMSVFSAKKSLGKCKWLNIPIQKNPSYQKLPIQWHIKITSPLTELDIYQVFY